MYYQYAVLLHLRPMHAFLGMHACRGVQRLRSGVFLHTCIYAYVGILPRETPFRVSGERPSYVYCSSALLVLLCARG